VTKSKYFQHLFSTKLFKIFPEGKKLGRNHIIEGCIAPSGAKEFNQNLNATDLSCLTAGD
jgi:hypothetical protein